MTWGGNVIGMREIKNAYKIVVGKLLATFYARFKKTVKIEVLNILMFTF